MWPRSLVLGVFALATTAGPAAAQRREKADKDRPGEKGGKDDKGDKADKDEAAEAGKAVGDDTGGKIPDGFEHIEVHDLTFTMRDEAFNALALDPEDPNIAYLGSHQGHIYKTTDRGLTWTESVVITQPTAVWQTGEGSVFIGATRNAGSGGVSRADLLGGHGENSGLGTSVPASLAPSAPFDPGNPLAIESAISSGGGGGLFIFGLSERAPRLSQLVGSKGRPVPSLNRYRSLYENASKRTSIYNITIDPNDRNRLFAGTVLGLYRSDDGGQSWTRTFAGQTEGERIAFRIAVRPGQPALMLLGTAAGLYIATDGRGDLWTKSATVGSGVHDVAFDLTDNKYMYLATYGSVMRSDDGGKTFQPIYFSTFPADANVKSIIIDPYDAETVYIGTGRGIYVTHNARAPSVEWKQLTGPQSALSVPNVGACSRHKGHLYAQTKLDLHAINYGAANPQSMILESWDGGTTWRELFGGVTGGNSETFAIDRKDPDSLWIAWTIGIHRLERRPAGAEPPTGRSRRPAVLDEWPTVSQVIEAMMDYHDLDLREYGAKLAREESRNLLPRAVTITGNYRTWSMGGIQDEPQFAADRYLQLGDAREWQVMAFASWNLPDLIFKRSSQPMARILPNQMNDELRRRLVGTIRFAYAETQRLRAVMATSALDTKTEVIYHIRIEQLEAVVDLTSGGYLTRWKKKRRRSE